MLNIKPISELRNYSKLLEEVKPNAPVILTKNGYGKYAIINLEEYERFSAGLELFEIVKEAKESGAMTIEEAAENMGLSYKSTLFNKAH
ncbi:type II toxin-antitoxin system prevent-host-death family antitoxin [Enterococcus sp.]|uniref:type II toxin-antitoxin system Phd/YefM family antitoxin n=1 Tax=Enterococcus sp. TaxID=35783 RepID=UPI002910C3C3|nr:type II toxin-antitoxin system prevent-host-death family antitoxin [Enterococcus sp.]MDU5336221.1 type II toxin-antitoxin system prevent-host-death family antitoxin [Enterococcus sp.]